MLVVVSTLGLMTTNINQVHVQNGLVELIRFSTSHSFASNNNYRVVLQCDVTISATIRVVPNVLDPYSSIVNYAIKIIMKQI